MIFITYNLLRYLDDDWEIEFFISVCICLKLARFVEEERMKHTVYPPADEVFAWTRMTDIMDVSTRNVVSSKLNSLCESLSIITQLI